MDYEQTCTAIQAQIWNYQRHNLRANRIILGKTVFDLLKAKNTELHGVKFNGPAEIFGIRIVVNHDNLNEISVGYVEEIKI